jgi:NTP pyrophosphatase (non-canonical NTP hydrolase)
MSARLRDLAERLVAAGGKAEHVSASECHEISDGLLELLDDKRSINAYQEWTLKPSTYPEHGTGSATAITYAGFLLAEEAGEVCGKISKAVRGDNGDGGGPAGILSLRRPPNREKIVKEMGDVLFALSRLADELGVNMTEVMSTNVEKLKGRIKAGTLNGSGDDR